jgi:hypothetical protein
MDWTGYEVPELHQAYIAKHGASPDITIFLRSRGGLAENRGRVQARRDACRPLADPAAARAFEPWDTTRLVHLPDLMPELLNLPTLQHEGQAVRHTGRLGHQLDLLSLRPREHRGGELGFAVGQVPRGPHCNDGADERRRSGSGPGARHPNPFRVGPADHVGHRSEAPEQRPLLRFYWSDPTQLSQPWRPAKWKSLSPGRRLQGVEGSRACRSNTCGPKRRDGLGAGPPAHEGSRRATTRRPTISSTPGPIRAPAAG